MVGPAGKFFQYPKIATPVPAAIAVAGQATEAAMSKTMRDFFI